MTHSDCTRDYNIQYAEKSWTGSTQFVTIVCFRRSTKTICAICHLFDTPSCQLMEIGVRGLNGHSAQPHAVQGHRVELVHVTTHNPRMEAMIVMVKQLTLSHVLVSHVQVCMW